MAGSEPPPRALFERLRSELGSGETAAFWVRAPGRVNLIGEHTDYTGGFVLPVAIDLEIRGVARARTDGRVSVVSERFGRDEFEVADPQPVTGDWRAYARAVIVELTPRLGTSFAGLDLALESDLPIGAGLSSSAALEAVVAHAVLAVTGASLASSELAELCRRAEHRGPQVACGSMDQIAVLTCPQGSTLFLDCRTLASVAVPFPTERWRIVALNSGVDRALATSAYNARRDDCQTAVDILRTRYPVVTDLSDVSERMLEEADLPSPIDRRCRHVVSENGRVLRFVTGLLDADAGVVGACMAASHASLRDVYEVSCTELDALVEYAGATGRAIGSRLTGAGFGGCTVNIVPHDEVALFVNEVQRRFDACFGRRPAAYVLTPSGAAAHGQLEE